MDSGVVLNWLVHYSTHTVVVFRHRTTVRPLKPASQLVNYKFRSLKNVDWSSFQADVLSSELYTNPADNVDEFAENLDTVITEILDRHCPLQERRKYVSTRRDNRWLSKDAVDAKRKRRQLERRWRSTRDVNDHVAYRKSCRVANKSIVTSRSNLLMDRIRQDTNSRQRPT